jgi:predicted nucleic acid-binding protein
MNYVVDASVCVKWYVPEIHEEAATRLLKSGARLHAPELIHPEFANIIWKKTRKGEITPVQGEKIIASFSRLRWEMHPHGRIIKSAYAGAAETGQTVYDWTYLALAVSLSCEFVTADEKFYHALERTLLKKNLRWIGDF